MSSLSCKSSPTSHLFTCQLILDGDVECFESILDTFCRIIALYNEHESVHLLIAGNCNCHLVQYCMTFYTNVLYLHCSIKTVKRACKLIEVLSAAFYHSPLEYTHLVCQCSISSCILAVSHYSFLHIQHVIVNKIFRVCRLNSTITVQFFAVSHTGFVSISFGCFLNFSKNHLAFTFLDMVYVM